MPREGEWELLSQKHKIQDDLVFVQKLSYTYDCTLKISRHIILICLQSPSVNLTEGCLCTIKKTQGLLWYKGTHINQYLSIILATISMALCRYLASTARPIFYSMTNSHWQGHHLNWPEGRHEIQPCYSAKHWQIHTNTEPEGCPVQQSIHSEQQVTKEGGEGGGGGGEIVMGKSCSKLAKISGPTFAYETGLTGVTR